MGAGGVLPTLRRQFNDMSRSPVMAGDFTSANDRKFHVVRNHPLVSPETEIDRILGGGRGPGRDYCPQESSP